MPINRRVFGWGCAALLALVASGFGVVWVSRARWQAMHQRNLDRAKEGPIDVLFLGDSIVEDFGTKGREIWNARYQPLNAANFGIAGDQTHHVLWRIGQGGELEGISPKVCVLLVGSNNLGLGSEDPQTVARSIRNTLDALRQKKPQMKILLLGIFPRDEQPGTPLRQKIAETNALIALYDDGRDIRYLDVGPKLLTPDGVLTREVSPDALHLAPKGFEIWAEEMQPLLEELLRETK